MKKNLKSLSAFLLILFCITVLFGCASAEIPETDETTTVTEANEATEEATSQSLWQTDIYTEDCTLGEGSKTVTVQLVTDKTVTLTIKTDKATVGEALFEHNVINGEEGPFGLYIKAVNGVVADYDADQSYWAFYEGENYAATGVDLTEIDEGVTYKLVYTKE